jgi:hypothetical protein
MFLNDSNNYKQVRKRLGSYLCAERFVHLFPSMICTSQLCVFDGKNHRELLSLERNKSVRYGKVAGVFMPILIFVARRPQAHKNNNQDASSTCFTDEIRFPSRRAGAPRET